MGRRGGVPLILDAAHRDEARDVGNDLLEVLVDEGLGLLPDLLVAECADVSHGGSSSWLSMGAQAR